MKKNDFSLLKDVNWEYLKRFKVCAESKSFREAAQVIGTSPNVIVTQMDSLEEKIGFKLFERVHHNRTHKLTFQGEKFLKLISIAYDYLNGALSIENHSSIQENFESKIKIITTPGLVISLLPQIIDSFLKKHPFYKIQVVAMGPAVEVQGNDFIIRTDIRDHPELRKEVLDTVSMNLYASKEYIEKMGQPKTIKDLKYHKIFTFDSFTYGNTNWALLPEEGFPVKTQIASNSVDFLYEMCVRGYGIVELAHIYKYSSDLIQILEDVESPKHTIYFAFHKSNLLDANMKKFIEHVLENFQK